MKDQYVGDVHDYRKYALIRALMKGSQFDLGVCWMLTHDDGGGDGRMHNYIWDRKRWRPHDEELFDGLETIVKFKIKYLQDPMSAQGVLNPPWLPKIEESGLLGSAIFVNDYVCDRLDQRRRYMDKAKQLLSRCNLVFFDPDNGLEVQTTPNGHLNSHKYVYFDEISAFWNSGASLLIYQHYPPRNRTEFNRRVFERISAQLPGCRVFLFATGEVLFILATQKVHVSHVEKFVDQIAWPEHFFKVCKINDELQVQTEPGMTNGRRRESNKIKDVCEMRTPEGAWTKISIDYAIANRGRIEIRCSECHGRVRAHNAAANGAFGAHFEHARRHDGCPLSYRFNGRSSIHPEAIS